jgi:epoxyqueuosine reductase QueG
MTLNQELIELLKQDGCRIIGFADLSVLPEEPRNGLGVGVVMATAYLPTAVWDRLSGKQRQDFEDYMAMGNPLERFKKTTKAFLKERGYKRNTTYKSMEITYKMLATLAGIGWIGRNAMLVTKEQGSAVRFTAVLTDAPFECGTPVTASLCPPNCHNCFDACPGKAIKGGLWERGIHRDEFYDVEACKKNRSACDTVCVAGCPFTQQGLGYNYGGI